MSDKAKQKLAAILAANQPDNAISHGERQIGKTGSDNNPSIDGPQIDGPQIDDPQIDDPLMMAPELDADDVAYQEEQGALRKAKSKRPPKRPTESRLRNQALYHIGRFEVSAAGLQQVLKRKAQRAAWHHDDIDTRDIDDWIAGIIADFVDKGWINDDRFAETRLRSLSRQGKSARAMQQNLMMKGVSRQTTGQAMGALNAEETDLQRACRYVRKRRLGPCRASDKQEARWEKDKAALMRAGFAFDVVDRVFACDSIDAVFDLEQEEE